jgi:hypothetical protein
VDSGFFEKTMLKNLEREGDRLNPIALFTLPRVAAPTQLI